MKVEGILVERRTIYAALAVLALSAPAAAQGYEQGYERGYGPGLEPGGLPPQRILTILRSTGLDPLGPPMRRGPNYVMRAIADNDRPVRVVINARSGHILSVTPVEIESRVPPPRGGVSMGDYQRMPPGYVPSDSYRSDSYRPTPPGGYRAGAPVVDEDDEPNGYRNPNAPRPPGPLPGTLPSRSSNAAPPPPRGGAVSRDDDDASPPSAPHVITADPDRSGALPPPPERFPQRAAPVSPAKPKPVQRAAAAPPKQAPLPKPKPPVNAEAVPAPAAPQSAPEPAPQNAPASDETPH
jgi:hypothetical protein